MTKKVLSYNEAVSELEKILNKLENEEIDLDKLLENVTRASELITICKDKLRATEIEVEQIVQKLNSPE
ncbi:MAG: exodeoxyribonuclease VII small subunit [Bacteroidales bacterium]